MSRVIPESWLPDDAVVRRIISHWTGGTYAVSALDRKHYHVIIDGDGDAHRGDRRVGRVASHTRLLNTHSFGLSVAAMGGDDVRRGGPYGRWPLTQAQWERSAQAAAEVCHRYGLTVTPRTVLQHGEVTRVYGIVQLGKWDCNELPFSPDLGEADVLADYRRRVSEHLKRLLRANDNPVNVKVNEILIEDAQGRPIGYAADGQTWAWVRLLTAPLSLTIIDVETNHIDLKRGETTVKAAARIDEGRGYIRLIDLRQFPGIDVRWHEATRTAQIIV